MRNKTHHKSKNIPSALLTYQIRRKHNFLVFLMSQIFTENCFLYLPSDNLLTCVFSLLEPCANTSPSNSVATHTPL